MAFKQAPKAGQVDNTNTAITMTYDEPTTPGKLLIAVHSFSTNEVHRNIPAGWTERVVAPRSTFTTIVVATRDADGTETTVRFGTDATTNVNCFQELTIMEVDGTGAFDTAAITSGAGVTSLTAGPTATLAGGTKLLLSGTRLVNPSGGFNPAPANYTKVYDDSVYGNDRLTLSYRNEFTDTAAQSATQGWTTSGGGAAFLASFTYVQAPVTLDWGFYDAVPWVPDTEPPPPPAPVEKLSSPYFASQMAAYVNNHGATSNRTQAQWDQVATNYFHVHNEGHNWSKIINWGDLSTQAIRFVAGRESTHDATCYVNGTYTTQGGPWQPFNVAAHTERHYPQGIAVGGPTTGLTLTGSISATGTTLTLAAPSSVPSGLPGMHPSGIPSTFWPLIASKGRSPSNETFTATTSSYVSWVRIDDELIGLPTYTAARYTRSGSTITITNVFRGLWRSPRAAHSSGAVVRIPDYVGSTGATAADQALSGNPIVDSTGRVRYVNAFYDEPRKSLHPFHDGIGPIADTVAAEQHALDLNNVRTVTNVGTTVITSNNHGFSNGQRVEFGGSSIAPGVRSMTPYYVVGATTNTFQVALTAGGTPIEVNRPPGEWAFGTWVLHQLDTTAEFNANEAAIASVLADPGCVGFSMRMEWAAFEADPSLRQRGKDLADAAGKKFSFRIMAGRHTPGRIFTDGAYSYQSEGLTHPKPFSNAGVGGNPVFEANYEAAIAEQVEWARARGIRLVHSTWYGWKWSEFYNGTDLVNATGYSWAAALEGARRLIEIDKRLSGYDIAIEHSTSGHYDDPAVDEYTQMVAMLSDMVGNDYPGLFTQGNNMNDQAGTLGRPAASLGLNHGKQSVSSTANGYDWNAIYDAAIANNYYYIELYTAQWTGGTSATLRSRAASWLSGHTYTPPQPTDMVVARLVFDSGTSVSSATELDVSSVATYNNGDGWGRDFLSTSQLNNYPYSYVTGTASTLWSTRQRGKASPLYAAIQARGVPAAHKLYVNNFLAQPGQVAAGERLNMVAGNEYEGYFIEHYGMEPNSLVGQITQACQFMAGVNSSGTVVNPTGHRVLIWIKSGDWKGGVFTNSNGDQYIRLGYGMWCLTWRATATTPELLVKSYSSAIEETPSDTAGKEIFHWDIGVPTTQPGGKPTDPLSEADIHQPVSGLYLRMYDKAAVLVNVTSSAKQWTTDDNYRNVMTETNRNGVLTEVPNGTVVNVPAYDSVILVRSGPSPYTITRQTSPDRSEVAYSSNPGTTIAVFTDGARTVRFPQGPERTFTQVDLPIWDTFNRTRTDDWGITSPPDATWATTTWSELGGTTGPGGDYSTTGTAGRMTLTDVVTSRRATLHNMDASDTDVTTRVRFQHAPLGGSSEAGIILRYVDSDNYYYARVRLSHASGTILVGSRKNVAGSLTAFGTEVDTGVVYGANTWLNLRADMIGSVMRIKVWADGASEPGAWTFTSPTDTTFTSGRAGMRANLQAGSTVPLPSYVEWDDYRASGTDASPTTVTHNTWVRLLDAPFAGTVDEGWLTTALGDTSPDVFGLAAQYLFDVSPVIEDSLQVAGPTDYSPIAADGSRDFGADWNDYLGIDGVYPGYANDPPEVAEFQCLDCSGYVRMIFGYRLGYPMTYAFTVEAGKIPRTSELQYTSGPGVVIIPDTGSAPALTGLEIGDIVFFDVDTGGTEMDHMGIYFGTDAGGSPRFISSRKSPNGPTFSDNGGNSTLDGGGTYANAFRAARRY